jgi:hypothetical protein
VGTGMVHFSIAMARESKWKRVLEAKKKKKFKDFPMFFTLENFKTAL